MHDVEGFIVVFVVMIVVAIAHGAHAYHENKKTPD